MTPASVLWCTYQLSQQTWQGQIEKFILSKHTYLYMYLLKVEDSVLLLEIPLSLPVESFIFTHIRHQNLHNFLLTPICFNIFTFIYLCLLAPSHHQTLIPRIIL